MSSGEGQTMDQRVHDAFTELHRDISGDPTAFLKKYTPPSNEWSDETLYERNDSFKLSPLTLTPEDQLAARFSSTPEDNSLERVQPVSRFWINIMRGDPAESVKPQMPTVELPATRITVRVPDGGYRLPSERTAAIISLTDRFQNELTIFKHHVAFGEPYEVEGVPIDLDETLRTLRDQQPEPKLIAQLQADLDKLRAASPLDIVTDMFNSYRQDAIQDRKNSTSAYGDYRGVGSNYDLSKKCLVRLADLQGWSDEKLRKQQHNLRTSVTPKKNSLRGIGRKAMATLQTNRTHRQTERQINRQYKRDTAALTQPVHSPDRDYHAAFVTAQDIPMTMASSPSDEPSGRMPDFIDRVLTAPELSTADPAPVVAVTTASEATPMAKSSVAQDTKKESRWNKVSRRRRGAAAAIAGVLAVGLAAGLAVEAASSDGSNGDARPNGTSTTSASASLRPSPAPSSKSLPSIDLPAPGIPMGPVESPAQPPQMPGAADIPLVTMQDGSVWATVRNDLGRDPTRTEIEQVFAANKGTVGPNHLDLTWDTAQLLSAGYQFHDIYTPGYVARHAAQ